MRRSPGFTLIELMIVIAIISVIASVAMPNLLASKKAANESSAIATMRSLVSCQAQFRALSTVDSDLDGAGEYGTFGEIAGTTLLNARGAGPAIVLDPALLGPNFGNIDAQGRVRKQGYYFLIYLPDAALAGVPEAGGGGPQPAVDPDACENHWLAYGWPIEEGQSGDRAFFVNQRGEVFQTRMGTTPYGLANIPAANAALTGPTMNFAIASSANGSDGNLWTPLQ